MSEFLELDDVVAIHAESIRRFGGGLHLVKNHPFVDGKRRIGLGAALTFLGMNGFWVESTNDELIELTLGVAEGRVTKADVAVFFSEHAEAWD